MKRKNKVFKENSKEISQGDFFVKTKHNIKFVDDAINRGATIVEAKDLINYFDFSSINIVGVTGTNGKTTTTALIYSILLDLGYNVALQGTRGFYINDQKIEDYTLTTPTLTTNFEHIELAILHKCQYFIMEVSSHALAQDRVISIPFYLKVHTNITQDHLDYHKNIEEYRAIKNSFFSDSCKKLINKDDKNIVFNKQNTLTYSIDEPSTYNVKAYSFRHNTFIMLQKIQETATIDSELPGIFNIYNTIASVGAVDMITDNSLQEICDNVTNFGGVSGRCEVVSSNPYIIIDFAHTPDGMKNIFESFNQKDIIVVFGAGGDRDKSKRALMGKIASSYAKKIFITSDNPRFEDPDIIVEDILSGITNKANVVVDINRANAIKKAIDSYEENSVILILGKGDEEYQIIYDKKLPFNDKDIVSKILAS